jgi:hypothetical protein
MKKRLLAANLIILLLAFAPLLMAEDADVNAAAATKSTFNLLVNTPFLSRLQTSPTKTPTATVTVTQGKLNDTLVIKLRHFKKKLAFDLFTVENSPFLSNGDPNPSFVAGHFGLSWYQSDIQANSAGNATVSIKTILVNQIFGFDSGGTLGPTNTFNVGFWFNNPADAADCGFTGTTPFNGEHNAGPNAMISGIDPTSQLGPLCLDPSITPGICNP